MSESASSGRASKTLVGRAAGTERVLQIQYDGVLQSVDELIRAPDIVEYVAPGLIDLQVNGFAGVDYNDPSTCIESIAKSIRVMFSTGVTRLLPTVITGSEERITGALKNLAAARKEMHASRLPEAEAIAGFHVEGPHISPEDGPRGAHPREHVRPPDIDEFKRWQDAARGDIRLVTLSPEWEQARSYVAHVVRAGVVASIGHTKATPDQIAACIDAGATMSTHLGNGAHALLPKTHNYIWDQLAEDRLSAGFIVDGIHISGSFFRAALRAKGIERSVLVTDAVMPAMCAPGAYTIGQVEVELRDDGSVVLRGGTRLAGSVLRMDRAIANAVRFGGISLRDAIAMATINPARAARIAGRQRGLTPGEKADLIRFRWHADAKEFAVVETIVAGFSVYGAESCKSAVS
ncbi:MAG: N-acetylglucosamine-6-phosphate deacetylase [Acidobacteriaceae bacterium]|nr:N-acetylglucosamine-6-phosphate deacetylase [Acidobacteriaceae bacterium]